METIFETYARTMCKNCKNKKECKEELRKRIDNTIKCEVYEKENDIEGYKEKVRMSITAKKNKPIMKGIDK